MNKVLLTAACLSIFSFVSKAQITISAAHAQAIGNTVTVKGIVLNGSELGSIRYIDDGTAAVAVYGTAISSVNRGDSLKVTAVTSNYNNLLELSPVNSYTVTSTAQPLPTPALLTPNQYDEAHEGMLIETQNVVFTNGGSTFAGNTNYTYTSNGETGTVRINNGNPLVGTFIPVSPVTMHGILSQFCTSPTTGCTTGYQVLLRDANDLISGSSINIVSLLTQVNMTTTGFDVHWTTDVAGSTLMKYGLTPNLELGFMSGTGGSTSHSVSLTGLNPGSIYYVKAYSVLGTDTAHSPVKAYGTVSLSSGNMKVYFNNNVNNAVSTGTNAIRLYASIDDTLIAYLNRAKYTLDMTIYDFDNNNITNITQAINNAYNRGVKVRFISDGDENPTNYGLLTMNPGIPQIISPTTSAYGIMHNKFVVIDANSADPMDPIVWTGSTNWTDNQINSDPNNVIIFQDQTLARAYRLEFEEMWGDTGMVANMTNSKFGPYKTDNTPHEFSINGKRVECYFSPSDGVNAKIIQKVNTAANDIEFASMLITRTDIATNIANMADAGVSTYGIVDDQSTTTTWTTLYGSMFSHLADYTFAHIMHHKYLIVDQSNPLSDPIVLTGSHNWSSAAETKNDENTVIVHDATIANIYFQEFSALFNNNAIGLKTAANNASSIHVFPNPAGNKITVQSSVENELQKVGVYTIEGRKVMEKEVGNGLVSCQLDLSDLSAGVYIVQCLGAEDVQTVRLIKQ